MAPAREIAASRLVAAPQDELFDFLANLENHWRLADRFIDVIALERGADRRVNGARVRMRGPLGVRREAATQVLAADPPQQMLGVADVGRRTRAFVRWKLRGGEGGTRVRLEATIDRVPTQNAVDVHELRSAPAGTESGPPPDVPAPDAF